MKGVFKMLYGYARVSTEDQCLDRQIDALKAAGVKEELIYREKISGTKSSRPKLNALLDVVEKDDIIVIEALNRLGRSSSDLITLMKTLHEKGVILKSLKENLDFSTVQGQFIANFLALMAQFEHDVIVSRISEGLAAAKLRGRTSGRPPVNPRIVEKALSLYDKHSLNVVEICRACGISRPTLYKALHQREDKEELERINK